MALFYLKIKDIIFIGNIIQQVETSHELARIAKAFRVISFGKN